MMPARSRGRPPHLAIAAAVLVLLTPVTGRPVAQAAPGSPAVTPPLGWNSWNSFGCGVNETQVRQTVDAIVDSGMRDAGYQYIVVDNCWFDPRRDAAGNLRAHPTKFPGGMKALGDYIHGRGLKFGIYQVPTERIRAQRVGTHPGSTGSLGHGSNRCLDVDNASTAAGATVLICDYHTADNQQWTTCASGEIHVFGDKCLDAFDRGTVNGTRVVTWPCNGHNNQRWTVNSDGSIRNAGSGLCLDVNHAAGTANGSAVILWACKNQSNQR